MHTQLQTNPATNITEVAPQLAVLPQPEPKKRTRNGKIARLPYLRRDMVNRMLRNNVPYHKIRDALEEHSIRVTERNTSNWKTRGGYKEWCLEQDCALETRLLQDNLLEHLRKNGAGQLPEVGLQLAATHLSQFFAKPETQQKLATEPDKVGGAIAILCRLARQLLNLQKYRDDIAKELGSDYNPECIKREEEKQIESTRRVYSAAKLGETIHEPDIPHRNHIPRTS